MWASPRDEGVEAEDRKAGRDRLTPREEEVANYIRSEC